MQNIRQDNYMDKSDTLRLRRIKPHHNNYHYNTEHNLTYDNRKNGLVNKYDMIINSVYLNNLHFDGYS